MRRPLGAVTAANTPVAKAEGIEIEHLLFRARPLIALLVGHEVISIGYHPGEDPSVTAIEQNLGVLGARINALPYTNRFSRAASKE